MLVQGVVVVPMVRMSRAPAICLLVLCRRTQLTCCREGEEGDARPWRGSAAPTQGPFSSLVSKLAKHNLLFNPNCVIKSCAECVAFDWYLFKDIQLCCDAIILLLRQTHKDVLVI